MVWTFTERMYKAWGRLYNFLCVSQNFTEAVFFTDPKFLSNYRPSTYFVYHSTFLIVNESIFLLLKELLKPGQNKKSQKIFQLHRFLNIFLQRAAEKKYSKNRAAGKFFGPSYFVTALAATYKFEFSTWWNGKVARNVNVYVPLKKQHGSKKRPWKRHSVSVYIDQKISLFT